MLGTRGPGAGRWWGGGGWSRWERIGGLWGMEGIFDICKVFSEIAETWLLLDFACRMSLFIKGRVERMWKK